MRFTSIVVTVIGMLAGVPAVASDGHRQHRPKTVYVFGDSLSDNGNANLLFPDLLCPFWCDAPWAFPRYSNGPIWPDYMGIRLGKAIAPEVDGGTDYALGGATISPDNPYNMAPAISGYAEVDTFLAQHASADPEAIYVVWLGPNDIDPPASFTEHCFEQLVVMIQRLYDAGARVFLVPNLTDEGSLPVFRDIYCVGNTVYCDELNQMTAFWNDLLRQLPGRFPKARIRISDYHWLMQMVTQFPALLGFKNSTDPCWRDRTDGAMCSDPDDYWYFEYSHPTSRAQKVIADYFLLDMLIGGELKITDLVAAR